MALEDSSRKLLVVRTEEGVSETDNDAKGDGVDCFPRSDCRILFLREC